MPFFLPEGQAFKEGLPVLPWVANHPSARRRTVGGGQGVQIQLWLVANPGHILLYQVAIGGNVSTKLTNFSLNWV